MVFINGAVHYPGEYVVKHPNERISDIITRAGGLRPNAYPIACSISRKNQIVQLDMSEIFKNKIDISLTIGTKQNILSGKHN